MNRLQRAQLAQETLQILNIGVYQLTDGREVSIREALATACAQTVLYRPGDYAALVARLATLPVYATSTIRVVNCTTLAAAAALVSEYPTLACLNFASAKHPGGGFLSGSQAQEESLARSSGFYAALNTQPEFYAYHRREGSSFYSDHVIFAPGVPVFRDDSGRLLPTPWRTAFITAAAVNAGAVRQNEPAHERLIEPTMEQRVRMILAVAALHGCAALVLGAWGCGVFRNDPSVIAAIFARVLAEPEFQRRFRHLEFAVYDPTPDQSTIDAFRRGIGSEQD